MKSTTLQKSATPLSSSLSEELTIPKETEQTLVVETIDNTIIRLEEGSKLTLIFVGTEGWEGLRKITFKFIGRESELKFLGFIIGDEKNAFSFETISQHLVPQTKAHYLVRGVMFDHSLVDYKGNIIIEKNAQLTDTYLAHHTLLMSDFARARSIPALEIEADDVKAGHAATIGKVDEEIMFYLKSRGLESKEAYQILIEGFLEEGLKMVDEKVQTTLRPILQKALLKTQKV